MANEFGKVEFKSQHEVKEGFLLRENRTGLVLEKLTKDGGTDVVAEYEGARISIEVFFEMCLKDARKYVGNKNTPIYVDVNPWDAPINQQQ